MVPRGIRTAANGGGVYADHLKVLRGLRVGIEARWRAGRVSQCVLLCGAGPRRPGVSANKEFPRSEFFLDGLVHSRYTSSNLIRCNDGPEHLIMILINGNDDFVLYFAENCHKYVRCNRITDRFDRATKYFSCNCL